MVRAGRGFPRRNELRRCPDLLGLVYGSNRVGATNLLRLFRRCKDLREALVLLVVIEGTAEQSPASIPLDRFKQATGLHQTTIYAALHELRMKGLIRRPSPGCYAFASEEARSQESREPE